MNAWDVKKGMTVRYHPISAGKHDRCLYRVRHVGELCGRTVAWLEGKTGCVDVRALSKPKGLVDDGYGLDAGGIRGIRRSGGR